MADCLTDRKHGPLTDARELEFIQAVACKLHHKRQLRGDGRRVPQ